MGRGEHDALFPDRAAARVFDEVYFVKNDVFDVSEPLRVVVYDISKYFGCHYKAGRVLVYNDVARYYSDLVAVSRFEIAVFLVGKRLDRRGVYDFGVLANAFIYYVFGYEGFSGSGRSADYYRILIVYGFQRLNLEIVQGKIFVLH